jgi:hypothetical protein
MNFSNFYKKWQLFSRSDWFFQTKITVGYISSEPILCIVSLQNKKNNEYSIVLDYRFEGQLYMSEYL